MVAPLSSTSPVQTRLSLARSAPPAVVRSATLRILSCRSMFAAGWPCGNQATGCDRSLMVIVEASRPQQASSAARREDEQKKAATNANYRPTAEGIQVAPARQYGFLPGSQAATAAGSPGELHTARATSCARARPEAATTATRDYQATTIAGAAQPPSKQAPWEQSLEIARVKKDVDFAQKMAAERDRYHQARGDGSRRAWRHWRPKCNT